MENLILDNRLTNDQIRIMTSPFALDLVALFKQLNQDISEIINNAIEDELNEDQLIQKVMVLFEENAEIKKGLLEKVAKKLTQLKDMKNADTRS